MYAILPRNLVQPCIEVEREMGNGEKIDEWFTPYNFSDSNAYIVDKYIFDRIVIVMDRVTDSYSDEYVNKHEESSVWKIIQSSVEGLVSILTWFYQSDISLDNIVPGEIKESEEYQNIASVDRSQRFIWGHFSSYFKKKYYEEFFVNDKKEDVPVEEKEKDNEEYLKDLTLEEKLSKLITVIFRTGKIYDNKEGVPSFYVLSNDDFDYTDIFKSLPASGDHKFIICKNNSDKSTFISEFRAKFSNELPDNFIFILLDFINDRMTRSFELTNHSLWALGEKLEKPFLIVKKISESPKESPYADFDMIFKDYETNTVFGLKRKNVIYITFNFLNSSSETRVKVFNEIFFKMCNVYTIKELKMFHKKYYEKMNEDIMNDFVNISVNSSKEHLNEIEEFLGKAIEEIGKLQKELMEKLKVYGRYKQTYDYFDIKKFEKDERAKALSEFESVRSLDKVSKIFIDNEIVHVYTNNIYAKDERTDSWHDIGTFHIAFGILMKNFNAERSINIENTKHKVKAYGGHLMQAPHVFNNGNMCAGNLVTAVNEHYKNRNIYGLILSILTFLESANVDDSAGTYINRWPEVSEEEAKGTPLVKVEGEKNEDLNKEEDEALLKSLPV